jgi:hypothetical protein
VIEIHTDLCRKGTFKARSLRLIYFVKPIMRLYESDLYLMKGRGGMYVRDPEGRRRGAGVGSLFSSIFSSVVPFVKKALNLGKVAAKSSAAKQFTNELKRTATQAGLNVVADALQGKNVLQSSKREAVRAAQKMGQTASRQLRGLANLNSNSTTQPKKKVKPKAPGKKAGGKGGKKTKAKQTKPKKPKPKNNTAKGKTKNKKKKGAGAKGKASSSKKTRSGMPKYKAKAGGKPAKKKTQTKKTKKKSGGGIASVGIFA